MEEIIEHNKIQTNKLNSQYYCYILFTANPFYSNHTYNGSTNNLTRRLRQHNGELVGGAKSTSNKGPWDYLAVMSGFSSHKEALSCEWRIKHPTGHRVRPKKYCGVEGRIKSLNLVLNLEKWTNNSTGLESGNEYTIYLHNEHMILIDSQQLKPNIKIKSIDELIDKLR
jgi:predicted GIY-YIG superfamily endonuclease